jgi:hypothetical protein
MCVGPNTQLDALINQFLGLNITHEGLHAGPEAVYLVD